MKKKYLTVAAIALMTVSLSVNAQIVDKKTSNIKGVTPPATKSDLGSEMKLDNDFNLKAVQEAFDESSVKENIKEYAFNRLEIYKIRTRVNMSTLIVLPDWEVIDAFEIADSEAFVLNPFGDRYENMISVQGIMAGIDTNLKIIGVSGNIYNFYIRTDPINSEQVPDYTVFLTAAAPADFFQKKLTADGYGEVHAPPPLPGANLTDLQMERADYLQTLPAGESVNADYKMTGDIEIAPHGVFDDGKWTYFDFRDALPSDRAPIIMKVMDGYDSQINTRWKDGFMIAETVSIEGWTLKNGKQVVCVRKR